MNVLVGGNGEGRRKITRNNILDLYTESFNIMDFLKVIEKAREKEGRVLIFLSKKYPELKVRKYTRKNLQIITEPKSKICGVRAHFIFYEDLLPEDWVKKVLPPMFNVRREGE